MKKKFHNLRITILARQCNLFDHDCTLNHFHGRALWRNRLQYRLMSHYSILLKKELDRIGNSMAKEEVRGVILGTVGDLAHSFLYYDRKEDPDLKLGEIEKAVKNGLITIEDMVNYFRRKLEEELR